MPSRNRQDSERLGALVEEVLRNPAGLHSADVMAQRSGFSRSHFSRHFFANTGESPSSFVQRIRLEMAGYLLRETREPIDLISHQCGYLNASAFARAFQSLYGVSPSLHRAGSSGWRLPSPQDLHWNPAWLQENDAARGLALRFPVVRRPRNPKWVAAIELFGNYSWLHQLWESIADRLKGLEKRRFYTVYYDKVWTHPQANTMRAHLAYELEPGEEPRPGFERLLIPGGMYNTFGRAVLRKERDEAWSWIVRESPGSSLSFDEYAGIPLPFEKVLTAIWCLEGEVSSNSVSATGGL